MLSNLRNSYSLIKSIMAYNTYYDIFKIILDTYFDLIHQDIYDTVYDEVINIHARHYTDNYIAEQFKVMKHIGTYTTTGWTNLVCSYCSQLIRKVVSVRSNTHRILHLNYCCLHFEAIYDDYWLFDSFVQIYYPKRQ